MTHKRADLPDPPYPADTQVTGWRFQFDVPRAMQSDTWTCAPPGLRPWLSWLWIRSWLEVPAGSYPNNDALIAAKIGTDVKLFRKHRAILMRGWYLCSDNRLYHPVIAELVLFVIHKKEQTLARVQKYRDKVKQADREPEGPDAVTRDSNALHGNLHSDEAQSAPENPEGCNTLLKRTGFDCGFDLEASLSLSDPEKEIPTPEAIPADVVARVKAARPELKPADIRLSWKKFIAHHQGQQRTQEQWHPAFEKWLLDERIGKTTPAGNKGNANGGTWWTSETAAIAKGNELGLQARAGESLPAFCDRIRQHLTTHSD